MLRKNRLFTPGPTPLLPAAQTAMASFTAHHRTADFKALFQRVLYDMKEFIGTKNDVLALACSGTGLAKPEGFSAGSGATELALVFPIIDCARG